MERWQTQYRDLWQDVRSMYAVVGGLESAANDLLSVTKKNARRGFRKANKNHLRELVQEANIIYGQITDLMDTMPEDAQEYMHEASESLSSAAYLLEQLFSNAVTPNE